MYELAWRKSSYSGGGNNCVEVADLPADGVAIRDSKSPESGHVRISPDQWALLMEHVKNDL